MSFFICFLFQSSNDGKRGSSGQAGQDADEAAEDEEPSSSSSSSVQVILAGLISTLEPKTGENTLIVRGSIKQQTLLSHLT
jgi:hypothetical protein